MVTSIFPIDKALWYGRCLRGYFSFAAANPPAASGAGLPLRSQPRHHPTPPFARFDISIAGNDVGFLFGGVVMAKLGVIVLQVPPLCALCPPLAPACSTALTPPYLPAHARARSTDIRLRAGSPFDLAGGVRGWAGARARSSLSRIRPRSRIWSAPNPRSKPPDHTPFLRIPSPHFPSPHFSPPTTPPFPFHPFPPFSSPRLPNYTTHPHLPLPLPSSSFPPSLPPAPQPTPFLSRTPLHRLRRRRRPSTWRVVVARPGP